MLRNSKLVILSGEKSLSCKVILRFTRSRLTTRRILSMTNCFVIAREAVAGRRIQMIFKL
ncbi:hypothetical protein DMC01_03590 [Campylobacter troglodytis]|nr:hypothetical protein DMC01_03590 [Campylobacter troglodytis]